MCCSKNVPLGMKGETVLVSQYQLWCLGFFLKEVCPSQSVCFTWAMMSPSELIHFLGLMSIQWMPRLTAKSSCGAKQQVSVDPYGVSWPRLPKLSCVSFLVEPCPKLAMPLVCKEEIGVKGPSPQICRLLWTSVTGLSPGSPHICLSGTPSSVITATTLKDQPAGVGH